MTEYNDPLQCYQKIGNLLTGAVPEAWNDIEVEALLDESSVDLLIMYSDESGRKKNIDYVPMLARAFYDLARAVSDERKGFYKKCVLNLQPNGKFNVDFTY
jgi:hypothetical protein